MKQIKKTKLKLMTETVRKLHEPIGDEQLQAVIGAGSVPHLSVGCYTRVNSGCP